MTQWKSQSDKLLQEERVGLEGWRGWGGVSVGCVGVLQLKQPRGCWRSVGGWDPPSADWAADSLAWVSMLDGWGGESEIRRIVEVEWRQKQGRGPPSQYQVVCQLVEQEGEPYNGDEDLEGYLINDELYAMILYCNAEYN